MGRGLLQKRYRTKSFKIIQLIKVKKKKQLIF
jgi:hypothetical protein